MLDNPEKLREMVKNSEAHSTDLLAPESAEELTAKTEQAAQAWAVKAGELWDAVDEGSKKSHRNVIYGGSGKASAGG